MKKLFFAVIAILAISSIAFAQVPQHFNYQGIARDAQGNPLRNQNMTLKLSVLPTADASVAEYEEIQSVKTNEFGLYTLQIGNGTAVLGSMKSVKWETGNKYIQVGIDPSGGSNFIDIGTTQLLSVPYAIYADKAGTTMNGSLNQTTRTGAVNSEAAHVAGDAGYLSKFTGLNTIGKSAFFQSATGTIGLGTAAPTALAKFHIKQENPIGGSLEYLRMQNLDPNGFGKFIMHNDVASNYATFTKYGSTYPGGYPGPNVATQFPYANLLAFGNNTGPFLLSNNGNLGMGIVSAGNTILKFNVTHANGNVGIGGSATPAAAVHFNNNATNETLLITNNTSGHTSSDGFAIGNNGNTAFVLNKENADIQIGVNSAPNIIVVHSSGTTEFNGPIQINGGSPGAGKILVSDASGLGSWQTGPVGPAGPIGPQGPIGLTGATGPAGADGQGGLTVAGDGIAVTGTGTVVDPFLVSSRTYTIGLWPELGGYVFWVSPDGKHGLVVETIDQPSISWYEAHNVISNPANHSVNGAKFRDWRLPSLFELGEILLQKVAIGGFSNVPYWSGTEYDGADAWSKNFNNGNELGFDKFGDVLNIRSVRSF
jgi:hypothetical protein